MLTLNAHTVGKYWLTITGFISTSFTVILSY